MGAKVDGQPRITAPALTRPFSFQAGLSELR